MADGGGTGSSGSWWNSLTNSRKKNKEAAGGTQPPAQPAPGEPAPPVQDWTSSSRENQHPSLLGGAGEPHKLDKLGGEKSGNSRRNLKISRSGRFKEKRKNIRTRPPDFIVLETEVTIECSGSSRLKDALNIYSCGYDSTCSRISSHAFAVLPSVFLIPQARKPELILGSSFFLTHWLSSSNRSALKHNKSHSNDNVIWKTSRLSSIVQLISFPNQDMLKLDLVNHREQEDAGKSLEGSGAESTSKNSINSLMFTSMNQGCFHSNTSNSLELQFYVNLLLTEDKAKETRQNRETSTPKTDKQNKEDGK
ncbi:hypothetical protein MG293_006457 [Ovis ammon polii]|uniref:Proline-rich protein 15 n=1 Tax=Ovis ammon polii TaxID=230172 RepID=A0AAD4UAW4_OVIAM|nr:hypothetical protein MG293_006457 [Ovis ammon polii]